MWDLLDAKRKVYKSYTNVFSDGKKIFSGWKTTFFFLFSREMKINKTGAKQKHAGTLVCHPRVGIIIECPHSIVIIIITSRTGVSEMVDDNDDEAWPLVTQKHQYMIPCCFNSLHLKKERKKERKKIFVFCQQTFPPKRKEK